MFTAFPVLTQTTGFREQRNTGEVLALQCQIHSPVNLFGPLFVEIPDSLALVFVALKKKKSSGVVVVLGILIVSLEIG